MGASETAFNGSAFGKAAVVTGRYGDFTGPTVAFSAETTLIGASGRRRIGSTLAYGDDDGAKGIATFIDPTCEIIR
jgi:hypothetical protein